MKQACNGIWILMWEEKERHITLIFSCCRFYRVYEMADSKSKHFCCCSSKKWRAHVKRLVWWKPRRECRPRWFCLQNFHQVRITFYKKSFLTSIKTGREENISLSGRRFLYFFNYLRRKSHAKLSFYKGCILCGYLLYLFCAKTHLSVIHFTVWLRSNESPNISLIRTNTKHRSG